MCFLPPGRQPSCISNLEWERLGYTSPFNTGPPSPTNRWRSENR